MRTIMELIMKSGIRRRIAFFLAVVVTFTTVYSLLLPAITLEKETAETMSGIDPGNGGGSAGKSGPDDGDESDSELSGGSDGKEDSVDTVSYDAEIEGETDSGEAYELYNPYSDSRR